MVYCNKLVAHDLETYRHEYSNIFVRGCLSLWKGRGALASVVEMEVCLMSAVPQREFGMADVGQNLRWVSYQAPSFLSYPLYYLTEVQLKVSQITSSLHCAHSIAMLC